MSRHQLVLTPFPVAVTECGVSMICVERVDGWLVVENEKKSVSEFVLRGVTKGVSTSA